MRTHLRRRTFVDRSVQGKLLSLFVRCWAVSVGTAGGLTVIGWIFITPGISGFVGPTSFMVTILPMVMIGCGATLLVLPVMLYDMVKVTHRFAGPILRFKRHLRAAADGGPLSPITFRDGDEWQELAEAYNALLSRFEGELEIAQAKGVAAMQVEKELASEAFDKTAPANTPLDSDRSDERSVEVPVPATR